MFCIVVDKSLSLDSFKFNFNFEVTSSFNVLISLLISETLHNEYFYSPLLSVSIRIFHEFEFVIIISLNKFQLPLLLTVTYSFSNLIIPFILDL